ncbi:Peptidoglycan recognition protein [Lamellibrachia satsuma]|nr:Peptidoglycan recognition protein [Lamellibrachia satsuma]
MVSSRVELTDIGYNFLVGGDGRAYVGRGWGYMGGHSQGHNGDSVAIAAMGDFDSEEPSEKMIDAMANLIACAVQQGVLQSNYEMLAHRQVVCTVSPGKYMCDVIKTSSHYSSKSSTEHCDN